MLCLGGCRERSLGGVPFQNPGFKDMAGCGVSREGTVAHQDVVVL